MLSSINTHDVGDLLRLSGTFTEAASSEVIDPTAIFLSVREPDGTLVTAQYGSPSSGDAFLVEKELLDDEEVVGSYFADYSITQAGKHYYRFWSTGEGQAAGEQAFDVRECIAIEQ